MILVTGGSGHLGANLVRRLLADGHEIRVLIRPTKRHGRALAGLSVQRAVGDLRDPDAVDAAVKGCERVYHCAARISTTARNHREIHAVNVLGTRNVLQAAGRHGVRRVVATGSFSATGTTPGGPARSGTCSARATTTPRTPAARCRWNTSATRPPRKVSRW